ncbi:hypothetical protein ORV05_22700 [Amycolatopsis cynarae]|uniref:Uncharacterized protein n=1 Tax=Amycolatopsis cynarae TaxID=2995223 RepID=A0ABY7AWC6_9PSEU|nr:hypothetical protein [Amycolatopsis sp. HUAS 11-8]WAL63798.1 hypothetical protein ORV05_22700 [Amycolatopsis sp. HUAS 11-8]
MAKNQTNGRLWIWPRSPVWSDLLSTRAWLCHVHDADRVPAADPNRIATLDDTHVDHELIDQAQDLADELTGPLTHYQATLQRHDIPLPYNPKN